MGRLTLNVLLSFAQFEREVTVERIRDKIAASERRGLWMGGTVALGYELDGRSLKIVVGEADTVRQIFALYLKLGSIYDVRQAAGDLGLRTKGRPKLGAKKYGKDKQLGAKEGLNLLGRLKVSDHIDDDITADIIGPAPFGATNIHYILTNPIYAGLIRHRALTHDGNHPAIIDPEIWDLVQEQLSTSAARQRGVSNQAKISLLAGKLIDDTGDRFTPTHANKQGVRFRYYVSNRSISAKQPEGSTVDRGWRLPAPMLESQLANAVVQHLLKRLPIDLSVAPSVAEIEQVQRRLEKLAADTEKYQPGILKAIDRATITQGQIDVALIDERIADALEVRVDWLNPDATVFCTSFQYRKRGVETTLIIGAAVKSGDEILVHNLAKAQQYYDAIKHGQGFDEIAKSKNLSTRRVMQIIDLAFLAPTIVQSIVTSDQPMGLTTKWLSGNSIPADWHAQRQIVASL